MCTQARPLPDFQQPQLLGPLPVDKPLTEPVSPLLGRKRAGGSGGGRPARGSGGSGGGGGRRAGAQRWRKEVQG